jgi:hypothetical protein
MKTEKEIREESRRIRERAKNLSGFWVAELAAAVYALEWTLGKAARAPSEDIGTSSSAEGKIAASLLKAAEKESAVAKPAPKNAPRPRLKPGPKSAAQPAPKVRPFRRER